MVQEIIFPADPKVRAQRVADFFGKCYPSPFPNCQSARVDVAVVFFFEAGALPKFTSEGDKRQFIQEVSTIIGMGVNVSMALKDAGDRVQRAVASMEPGPPSGQMDLPFPDSDLVQQDPVAPEPEQPVEHSKLRLVEDDQ